MVDEKKFNKDRILAGIEKLKKARAKKPQSRLDQFFTVKPASVATINKRKLEEQAKAKKQIKLQKGKGGKKAVKR